MATKKKTFIHHVVDRFKTDNERGARTSLIEELFYDFNRSKAEVYKMNFIRGIFFGVGSVIGGGLVIGVSAFLLAHFIDLPGGVGDFVKRVLEAINGSRSK